MNNSHYLKVVGLIAISFSLSVPVLPSHGLPSFFTFSVKEVLQHNLDCDLVLGINWVGLRCAAMSDGLVDFPVTSPECCQNPFIGYCESLCAVCLKLLMPNSQLHRKPSLSTHSPSKWPLAFDNFDISSSKKPATKQNKSGNSSGTSHKLWRSLKNCWYQTQLSFVLMRLCNYSTQFMYCFHLDLIKFVQIITLKGCGICCLAAIPALFHASFTPLQPCMIQHITHAHYLNPRTW